MDSRAYTVELETLMGIVSIVHRESGCRGEISCSRDPVQKRDWASFHPVCDKCGCDYGRIPLKGPSSVATAQSRILGVLLAGATFDDVSASCAFADLSVVSARSFSRHQHTVLRAIETVYAGVMLDLHRKIRAEVGRKVLVEKEEVYQLLHAAKLAERRDGDLGLKASDRATARTVARIVRTCVATAPTACDNSGGSEWQSHMKTQGLVHS